MANSRLKVTSMFLLLALAVICEATVENSDKESSESWTEWAKDKLSAGGIGTKAADLDSSDTNQFDDTAKKTKDKITDTTTGAGKYAADKAMGAKEKASESGEEVYKKTGDAKDKATDLGKEAYEKTGQAKDKASELGEEAYEKTMAAKDKASELGEEAYVKTEAAKDKTTKLREKAYEKAGEAEDREAEEARKRGSEAEDTLSWAKEKEKVKAGYDAAKAKAGETYEAAKDKSRNIMDNLHGDHDAEL